MENQEKRFYSVEELGKIAALFLSAPVNHGREREVCNETALNLEYFSNCNAKICAKRNSHASGSIAWEATNEYARFGEWSSDDIKATKELIKGMLKVAEDIDNTIDEEVELYRMIARIMAAILV